MLIEPKLLREQAPEVDFVSRNRTQYFFIPFMRQQAADSAFLLNKLNGDSFFFVRVIANAFAPYQTWNYPTQLSND